jgi:hypothetical protein
MTPHAPAPQLAPTHPLRHSRCSANRRAEKFSQLVSQYLTDARELLGDDGEAYKKAIVDRYPDYHAPAMIDIANQYLFG